MPVCITPYELLRRSKPHQPLQTTTDYDRFSLYQAYSSQTDEVLHNYNPPIEASPQQNNPKPQRSHYIADIHARHSSAMRRAPQNPPSL